MSYLDEEMEENLKRKVDYFFTPYNDKVSANKYLTFDERANEKFKEKL